MHKLFLNETFVSTVGGTAAGVVLGNPVLQTALINLGIAAIVRVTKWVATKRRARKAAQHHAIN